MDLNRRTLLQTSSLALGAIMTASPAIGAPGSRIETRRQVRLQSWRFHLGHASEIERDFGFGRNQRTLAKAGAATADAAMAAFDDSAWSPIEVPHDWAVGLPFARPASPAPKETEDAVAAHGFKAIGRNHPENSVGWYRSPIVVGPADRDRRIWLEFDGVFRDCLVFVNGYVVGRNESGYAPFRVEIDDFLDYDGGPNMVTVRVDASLGEGWFYEGAGIYRHVDLIVAAPVHVPQWGVAVRPEIDGQGALVRVSTEVTNSSAGPVEAVLSQTILDAEGRRAAAIPDQRFTLAAGGTTIGDSEVRLTAPQLWSIETPYLYRVRSALSVDGVVIDEVETPFGIRTLRFDAERGFFLNGKPVKLLGSCNHQDHAGVGAGIPDALHAWRVKQMQSMGSNAWRSAHNPPAAALLDICDTAGMLMIVETRLNSTDEEATAQLERIIRRDRNHPCVILWSLGNEEPHQGTERGARINRDMAATVRRLDSTRRNTFAMDNNWENGVGRVVDVIGFNYRVPKMEGFHQAFPHIPIYASETGSTVATRGEYATDPARHIVRAYDTEHPWWASTAEEWWTIAAERPYIAGGFIWTGFDYRGEPTPYAQFPSISSYFGVLDTCGFPKDNYWYYRAWWRPDVPLVHLLPHWNWPGKEGQPIEVWAHGNCDEIELLLNGKSHGRKAMPRNRHLEWSVPYAPGRLEAVGYNTGRRVARAVRETAGPAAAVTLSADRRMMRADGADAIVLRAEVVDAKGRLVPTADNLIDFNVTPGARVLGVGNGNPTSLEPDRADQRRAFNGLAQAIVGAGKRSGAVTLSVSSDGLRGASLRIPVLR